MRNILEAFLKKRSRIYLDYAAATPVSKEVQKKMAPYWDTVWANPGAIHEGGVMAREAIEYARERLARMLRVRASGVVFTSGGTEANNLAIIGTVEKLHREGRAYSDIEIITTKIEHPSILEAVGALTERGVSVVYVPLHEDGLIDTEALRTCMSAKTALVTFAYVNSEIGVVQDVKRLSRIIREQSAIHQTRTYIHIDGAQAPLWLPCQLDALGVDLISLDSGKCYGPKGVGVLVFRHGVSFLPTSFGGGQEAGLRSGTENTSLIIGCVESLVRADASWQSRSEHVRTVRDELFNVLQREIPGVVINGSREFRVANNANISIPGIDAEFAVISLDQKGVSASTKSACGAQSAQGSAVVRELTHDESRATSTIRFTLGEDTKVSDINTAAHILRNHVNRMRAYAETFTKK